jgi:hypothetical protein
MNDYLSWPIVFSEELEFSVESMAEFAKCTTLFALDVNLFFSLKYIVTGAFLGRIEIFSVDEVKDWQNQIDEICEVSDHNSALFQMVVELVYVL